MKIIPPLLLSLLLLTKFNFFAKLTYTITTDATPVINFMVRRCGLRTQFPSELEAMIQEFRHGGSPKQVLLKKKIIIGTYSELKELEKEGYSIFAKGENKDGIYECRAQLNSDQELRGAYNLEAQTQRDRCLLKRLLKVGGRQEEVQEQEIDQEEEQEQQDQQEQEEEKEEPPSF